ncbi:MAG TPA: extracellular solute-binding protein [Chloroflexota bacterium]|nr:extracellular solute-binding protein [Chloroflexota bacterium]
MKLKLGTTRRSMLLAGAGSVLAACGGAQEAGVSLKVNQPTTVAYLLNGNNTGTVTDITKKLYETEFRAQNPNITIDFQGSGSSGAEHIVKITALTAAGTQPDAFYLSNSGDMPALATKSVVRAVDDLIRADGRFKKDDWFEVHLGAWQYQKKQMGLPWQGGPLAFYYNKELLGEAGVAAPSEATWTFDAWRDAGNKLRRVMTVTDTPKWATDVGGQWLHWVYAFGGDVLDKDNKKCILDAKEALAGLQLMADFIHRDQIALKPQDFGGKTHAQLFMEKRLAMIVMNRQNASAQGFIQPWVAITQLPKGPAGRFSQGNIDGFSMGSQTKSPAAAWEAMKFRTGDPLRRELLKSGNGGIPALKTTANSQEYLNDKLPVEWNKMFTSTMSVVKLAPPIPEWSDVTAAAGQSIDQIKKGEVSPQTAMKDLAPRINALLTTK